ncbi:hydrogenase [bacterium CG17_big_fil_post_rev_8_21_14_2_50_64_8]|nr:MAG: hydrogenase [bacterium CG17_big_fil_post_rev_8_21_14_2_50_64_8]PJA76901.1 MAG: hydrogenase [bacterium CG_4_9_14_3_um_filter_65_15]
MMLLLIGAILLMACAGVPALLIRRLPGGGEGIFTFLLLGGVGLGLAGVVGGLLGAGPDRIDLSWGVPGGGLLLCFDTLSALFMLPMLLVVGAGGLYGLGYRPHHRFPRNGRRFRFFFGLCGAALLLLLVSRNSLLFLTAWEMMALSGFFLVTTDDCLAESRRAGYLYIVATHTGSLALFGMFALLGRGDLLLRFPATGSLAAGGPAGIVFALGLFGFGLKAGLMPLHVWLPSAHAAAPSHASALLSGVMLKVGIYGLVRLISFYADVPAWWGWTLLGMGVVSGVAGVVQALAQHDIKRLLAYHSVENIGIIAIGLGLAVLGRAVGYSTMVVFGLGGALLHVVNHGMFKSLLFLSAGSVVHGVGSREIEKCGGLLKRQPWTAFYFLVGAVAICGLPPLNGFVSEWLIFMAAFAAGHSQGSGIALTVLAAPALALIGALALACFVKVFGIVFLGTPRSEAATQAHEAAASMRFGMGPLALACIWIGLVPVSIAPLLRRATLDWFPALADSTSPYPSLVDGMRPLIWLSISGVALILLTAVAAGWLGRRSREAPRDLPTWGCGFACPPPQAQYSASSFADGLVSRFALARRPDRAPDRAVFPLPERFSSHLPDFVFDRVLLPVWRVAACSFGWFRVILQNGVTASYLSYMALTLLVLLVLFGRK